MKSTRLENQYLTRIFAQIRWILDEPMCNNNPDEFFFISVDGVHCRITEPRFLPSSGWYSHKHNKAGLAYEVAVAVYHDKICWINGPFPAGQNDLKIFRNGLMSKIPDDKRVIADNGYSGEPDKAAISNTFDPQELQDLKHRAKARQETVNSCLKSFKILNDTFRTPGKKRLERHKAAFEACSVILQYEFDNGSRKLMKV